MGREKRRRKDARIATKALVVSGLIAIFHPGDGKL